MTYNKVKKILLDRGFNPDNISFKINGNGDIIEWDDKTLGPAPTAQEVQEADGDFIVQRNKIRNKLMDPFEHLLALYLARKGDTSLLDKLDAKLDRVFEENPKIRIKDLL